MRVIARLDVKNEYVIKGIHLEGLRKVGNPNEMALQYYEQGIDEILFMDAVASLYDRNNLFGIIEQACKEVFVPITIGGGLRSLDDVEKALQAGADKVSINTAAVKNPNLVNQIALKYGSQCVVASIEAKNINGNWLAYTDNGRERTELNAIEWAKKLEDLGAGELLITSVDYEGTKKGFDLDLIKIVSENVSIPVLASGGAGKVEHISQLAKHTEVGAVVCASILHYKTHSINQIKTHLISNDIEVRV